MRITALEKNGAVILCYAIAIWMGAGVLSKTESDYADLTTFRGRSAFSSKSFIDPEVQPGKAIDADLRTAWTEDWFGRGRPCSGTTPEADRGPLCTFLQIDLGFTHSPGIPINSNPLDSLEIILPGPQGRTEAFARPRTVDLIFFAQEIVDMDRQFRLPPLPAYVMKKRVLFKDARVSTISLADFPASQPSPGYPGTVKRIWVRLEFPDVYPSSTGRNTIAISEIRYRNRTSRDGTGKP